MSATFVSVTIDDLSNRDSDAHSIRVGGYNWLPEEIKELRELAERVRERLKLPTVSQMASAVQKCNDEFDKNHPYGAD